MNKIAVRKSDGKIVSFGAEDMSRFNLADFDIMETDLESLPDELPFCFYKNGKVVVDEVLKEEILNAEKKRAQKRKEAKEYIEQNNPADIVSVPALRERVKRLEALLGICKWL